MFRRTALARAWCVKTFNAVSSVFPDVTAFLFGNAFVSAIVAFLNRFSMTTTRRLMRHFIVASAALLVVTSVSSYGGLNGAYSASFDSYEGLYLIADQEGYLTKLNPQTLTGERGSMTDRVTHVVAPGETVSEVAEKYGLKAETLLWENNIYNANSIKIGQKLVIPPVNGVTHKVKSGETLDKIAAKYKVEKDLIVQQNQLESETVLIGQELLIPGGKAIQSPYYDARSYPARTGTASRYVANPGLEGSTAAPSPGRVMIFPTRGKITKGFMWGHYAIDIADASRPPIWAATSGVVEKVASGWNGGYGNHVVIDHGGGLKTLYAHLEYYTVQAGQQIAQGEVIGKMGNTGRVYGRTGIHVHFEVIQDGVKQYPGNYW